MNETAEKSDRLQRLAAAESVSGILLTLQPNFAWLTGGRTNRIDGSREAGAGALLITVDGRRFAIASRIERPRLTQEALDGLEFEIVEYPWTEERADPGLVYRLAAKAAGGRIGTDGVSADALPLDGRITRLRTPLLAPEIERYRELGRDVGRILGETARATTPGATEEAIAGSLGAALMRAGIRPVVLLSAADDRISRFRHPVPTPLPWRHRLLLATCAERHGLVVAASRLVTAAAPDADLIRRTEAAARVCGALLEATRAGATGAALFEAAADAYSTCGYPGEEQLHHQGGAIGYRARDWVAHPRSDEIVTPAQAFAWNPTVTGTKIEETVLLHTDGRYETVTTTEGWPAIRVRVRDCTVGLPGILSGAGR
ncbi:MAG TPA: M24 family metallopeptidase [Vicinamibacterales bacterium]|nr:M24 family metallopeptidase [Vicinamibacterales bacterium]